MTFKEFCENAKINVGVYITVDDEIAFEMNYEDLDTAFDDYKNMDRAIDYTLESLWADLPDREE